MDEDYRQKVGAAIDGLVRKGFLRDSGRRRHGQIVWVLTELGKRLRPDDFPDDGDTKH
jgi:hypothetical protein